MTGPINVASSCVVLSSWVVDEEAVETACVELDCELLVEAVEVRVAAAPPVAALTTVFSAVTKVVCVWVTIAVTVVALAVTDAEAVIEVVDDADRTVSRAPVLVDPVVEGELVMLCVTSSASGSVLVVEVSEEVSVVRDVDNESVMVDSSDPTVVRRPVVVDRVVGAPELVVVSSVVLSVVEVLGSGGSEVVPPVVTGGNVPVVLECGLVVELVEGGGR